jgi:hypothetical protein
MWGQATANMLQPAACWRAQAGTDVSDLHGEPWNIKADSNMSWLATTAFLTQGIEPLSRDL